MTVDNLTSHCFVLAGGVIIDPNVVGLVVSDTLYQTNSTLNEQIDALDTANYITITGKPSDTFPATSDVASPVTLTANNDSETALELHAAEGQLVSILQVYDSEGTKMAGIDYLGKFTVGDVDTGADGLTIVGLAEMRMLPPDTVGPKVRLRSDNTLGTLLELKAVDGQSASLVEIYDAGGDVVFKVSADGTVHIKTGASVQADL